MFITALLIKLWVWVIFMVPLSYIENHFFILFIHERIRKHTWYWTDKEVSTELRKYWCQHKRKPESFCYCWPAQQHIIWVRLLTWEPATDVSKETYVWAGMFAKAPKLEPYFILWNTTFIYLLTSTRSRRADITKSATLMIDSRRTKHPALSGHFACCICSRKCLWSHYPLQLPYSTISNGGVRVGSWLTFNKEPLACWGKWEIRVCLWPF